MKNEPSFFITGTDTGVGKTIVSAALVSGLNRADKGCSYWKPVQAGTESRDIDVIQAFSKKSRVLPSLFEYGLAMSPDQAARLESKPEVSVRAVVSRLRELSSADQAVVIEGAGGVLVPLNSKNETWLDVLNSHQMLVLVVARSGLGTLNHISLTLKSLHDEGISPHAVLLNGETHEDNECSLKRLFPDVSFLRFPFLGEDPSSTDLAEAGATLLSKLVNLEPSKVNNSGFGNTRESDSRYCWHPYTQHNSDVKPEVFSAASGSWLTLDSGQRLIDGTSSWWVNTVGHGRPEIASAVDKQIRQMDHVIFAGATHNPAAHLAKRVIELTDGAMNRVFYSDNGSTAVEIGLKMAYQYWHNQGDTSRKKFLSFNGGYHGDTFGTMAVGGGDLFHSVFRELLFDGFKLNPLTYHKSYLNPEGQDRLIEAQNELRVFFEVNHSELAGVLIEPLVQGAGGMLMQAPEWLETLGELCQRYRVPLILDEVFTGMGRVGAYFAFQKVNIQPDIVCMAKGLTGGVLPLAITMAKESIFDAFLGDDKSTALLHGHSYTANATCCAAAHATLDIYQRENLVERSCYLESEFQAWGETLKDQELIENPRVQGAIIAFEIFDSGEASYYSPLRDRIHELGKAQGIFLRPLGNTCYFVPPLSISDEELEFSFNAIYKVLTLLKNSKS